MDSRERMKPARSGDELASGRKLREEEEERGLDDLFFVSGMQNSGRK